MPFLPRFHAAIQKGLKTATTRTQAYGKPGDILDTPAGPIKLLFVGRFKLGIVRDCLWRCEGLSGPVPFEMIWRDLHPKAGFNPDQEAWLHLFVYAGYPVQVGESVYAGNFVYGGDHHA